MGHHQGDTNNDEGAVARSLGGSAGCVETEAEDGINDSFLADGKSDAFGITEGSPDAVAVLTMLRTASLDDLDNAAGLASHAAKAILHHRQGGDRKDGTGDDDPIESLTELDAIPYVGPIAFRLLLDHARATVVDPSSDPFDPTFCGQDEPLTIAVVRATLSVRSTVVDPIQIETSIAGLRSRTRVCVTPDNCAEWVPGSQPDMFQLDGAQTPTNLSIPATGLESTMALRHAPDGGPLLLFGEPVHVEGGATNASLLLQCYPTSDDASAPFTVAACQTTLDDQLLLMTGTESGSASVVGFHCTQLVQRFNEGTTQRELVYFARY